MSSLGSRQSESVLRVVIILTGLLLLISAWLPLVRIAGASADQVQVKIDASQIVPRSLEESTGRALADQYSKAWKSLATALNRNDTDALGESFVGFALDGIKAQIAAQKKNGLSTRFVDHGHKVDALFYSPEGSAVELRDEAQLEIQLLDGSKVVSSENTTRRYVVVMTVVDDRWKVRVLDSVPNF
jgi:hypothetical protein